MYKVIFFLLVIFISGCSAPKPVSTVNANGHISWASGYNEKFYMPDSKRTISFISPNGLVIFQGTAHITNNPCDFFYNSTVKVKLCSDGDVMLFNNGKMINAGFVYLYNGY